VKRPDGHVLASGRARLCRSLIWQHAVRTSMYHVRTQAFCFLYQTHTTFCLFYHVVLCVFSLGLIPRFWHSLHIFSHSQVFPLTFLILLSFGSFLNIGIFNWLWFERLCMNIFFCLYAGWILLICFFWIAISALYFFMHPIDSHHNTTFFLKLTWSNISLWCYFWIDFCLNIFRNMLSDGF
jgi:hypothetical protein